MASVVFMMAVMAALMGGPFLYGFNTAVINTPADAIKLFCVEVYMTRHNQNFTLFYNYVKYFGRFPPTQPPSRPSASSNSSSPSPLPLPLQPNANVAESIATYVINRSNISGSSNSSADSQKPSKQQPQPLTDSETQAYICRNLNNLPAGSSLTTFWSITVAVYVLGGMVGAFLSGTFADRIGRRNGILVNQIFSIVGALLETATKFAMMPELLPVGRGFVGISCGIGVALGAMYLTEISPRRYRGKVGTSVQLGIVLGILVAQIVGLDIVFGNSALWPYCFAVSLVPVALCLLMLPCCPESPRFLSISKMNDEAARRAIVRLRGGAEREQEAENELAELLGERNEQNKGSSAKHDSGKTAVSVWKVLTKKQYALPIFLAIWLYVVQQWSGINAIFAYSETMFKSVDIPSQYIQYAVLSTGIVQIFCIFFSIACSEKIGRRRVMIYPTLVMSVLMILFTAMVVMKDVSSVLKYASLIVFLLYVAAYNLGCGTVPAFFVSEVFKQNSRGSAMTVAQVSHWFNSALVVYTFPFTEAALKEYTYLLYAGILLLSAIIFIIYMPETSGLSVNLLSRMLSHGFKVPIFVLQKKLTSEIEADRKRGSRREEVDDEMVLADTSRIMRHDSDRYN